MFEVDRSIVVVRPTLAFYDWYISVPGSPKETFAELREHTHSYMLPKTETKEPPSEIIPDDLAHAIFEQELMIHEIDHQHWPLNKNRVENLIEWFELQIVPLVIDPSEDELKKHWLLRTGPIAEPNRAISADLRGVFRTPKYPAPVG